MLLVFKKPQHKSIPTEYFLCLLWYHSWKHNPRCCTWQNPQKVFFVEHDARKESVSVNKRAGVLSTDNEHCVIRCCTGGAAPCWSQQPEDFKPDARNSSETCSFQEPGTCYYRRSSRMGVMCLPLIALLYTSFNSISRFKSSWKYRVYMYICMYFLLQVSFRYPFHAMHHSVFNSVRI